MTLLGRRERLEALAELDEELKALDVKGEIFMVGGAAMAIAYDTRRATTDVDAIFAPSSEVRTAESRSKFSGSISCSAIMSSRGRRD